MESPSAHLIPVPASAHTLLRLNPELPHKPLLDDATIYVDGEVGYDFPALILLAGLLIYRDIRPTPRWRKTTDPSIKEHCAKQNIIPKGVR